MRCGLWLFLCGGQFVFGDACSEDGACRRKGVESQSYYEKGYWRSRKEHTAFGPGLGNSNLYRPALPADLLVAAGQPRPLPPALLEELDDQLTAAAPRCARARSRCGSRGKGRRVGRGALGVELALEGGDVLLDHGLELVIVDVGQGQVEDFAGPRGERGEEAVEEDRVEDAYDDLVRARVGM